MPSETGTLFSGVGAEDVERREQSREGWTGEQGQMVKRLRRISLDETVGWNLSFLSLQTHTWLLDSLNTLK